MHLGNNEMGRIRMALSSLTVYRNLLEDKVLSGLKSLLAIIDNANFDQYKAVDLYNELYFAVISSGNCFSLRDYIIKAIVLDENPFTKAAEIEDFSYVEQVFRKAVENDLNSLQIISCSSAAITSCMLNHSKGEGTIPVNIFPLESDFRKKSGFMGLDILSDAFCSSARWSNCFVSLCNYYSDYGYGPFSLYTSFIWEHSRNKGFLRQVENPDPIKLSDLIDYESERSEVINNTLQLLDGQRANNVLLYGDRGTGKSSTVKAIVNEYFDKGLRIIEVPKVNLIDFGIIAGSLRNRRHKFIIFVDDLAFEDNEENYTALKAALEGGIESKPQNVAIYATSNRRHLVKEKFSDRQGLLSENRDEEIRAQDSIQEKLSLADRFGITVVFSSPDKYKYLKIVEGIAQNRGLEIDRETLHKEALKWELWYNGRSPRTARQFVDWLQGKK
ncbi:MAG TPA: ATP-binding protein [Clostridia bacterium]|nr:ATP-binding protein [Clostridia bacterium]